MSPAPNRVAAVQMISTPDVAENLAVADRLVGQAAAQGASLVALPEYFCLMGKRDSDKVDVRETFGSGPIQDALRASAQRHGVWLIGGTLPLAAPDAGKVLNSTLVFNPHGEIVARYDKIHLFNFRKTTDKGVESYDEATTITPGTLPASFMAPFGKVGLSICYDVRFPELYRALGDNTLIVVPAAFTATTGRAHWELLLRARAVENQCYVLASAQGGLHQNRRATFGHSMLIDPWGEVKAVLPEGEGVVVGDIDLAYLQEVRSNLPALQHRVL